MGSARAGVENPMNNNSAPTITFSISPRGMRPHVAAAYLGTTPSRIDEVMRDGMLPFRMLGDARVIAVADLNQYFDSLPKETGKRPRVGIHN